MEMPNLGDNYNMPLPEAEAFPGLAATSGGAGILRSSSQAQGEEEEPSSESAGAPLQRRRRAPKVLEKDETQELRNADLSEWNNNYLTNMTGIARSKQHHKVLAQAKKNAAFWVLGAGIGGVGSSLGGPRMENPLDMFSGDQLIETLRGVESGAGRKRSRSVAEEGQSSDSETRRVRAREEDSEQIGRGEGLALDDPGMMPGFDDDDVSKSCV